METAQAPISTCLSEPAPREPVKAEAPSPPGPEPRLGEVTVEEATPDTLHLSWTETEGDFDSFEVHYTDQGGQLQVLRIDGDRNDVILSGLESEHRYLVNLYGFHGQQRVGPAHIEALTGEQGELHHICFLQVAVRAQRRASPHGHPAPLSGPTLSLSYLSVQSQGKRRTNPQSLPSSPG